ERQIGLHMSHGITPASIVKKDNDEMEGANPVPGRGRRRVAEEATPYDSMTPEQLRKKAEQLEKRMLRHARDLEFEEAARLRDEIQRIRKAIFGLAERVPGRVAG